MIAGSAAILGIPLYQRVSGWKPPHHVDDLHAGIKRELTGIP